MFNSLGCTKHSRGPGQGSWSQAASPGIQIVNTLVSGGKRLRAERRVAAKLRQGVAGPLHVSLMSV